MLITQSQLLTIYHIQVVKTLNVASVAILIYDYFLTLSLEIEFAWGRKWSFLDVLFFITRYLPFIDTGISIYSQLVSGLSRSTCHTIYQLNGWSFTVAMCIAEVILTIRTWSLYNRDRRLGVFLIIFFSSCWAVIFLMMGLFLASSEVQELSLPELTTCFATVGDKLYVCWCFLMVFDGGIMILMLVQAVSIYTKARRANSPLLYIDGITYYILLFALSLTNVVVILTLPKDFVNLFSTLERVLHSVLTCRVILHVREQASRTTVSDSFIDQGLDALKGNETEVSPLNFWFPRDVNNDIHLPIRKRGMTVNDQLEAGCRF